MFKDRAFNLSILFSFAWHLFWICAIGIIITPTVQSSNVYQEIGFLGPILEKTAFDLMVDEVKPQAEILYAKSSMLIEGIYLKPKGPNRKVLKEFALQREADKFMIILQRYLKGSKEIPVYLTEEIDMLYTEKDIKVISSIEGPAQNREIIFKPESLTIPRGLYSDAEDYVIKLKFFVSNNGIVRDIEPVVSSGYPELDLEGIRFLKAWRFSPSGLAKDDESDWGIATVRIIAR